MYILFDALFITASASYMYVLQRNGRVKVDNKACTFFPKYFNQKRKLTNGCSTF